jgi:hypothetical protein
MSDAVCGFTRLLSLDDEHPKDLRQQFIFLEIRHGTISRHDHSFGAKR